MFSQSAEMRQARRPPQRVPSIAVLPLQNLTGDQTADYFADGIVENITTSLVRLRELAVVSRGSTLAYRGTRADLREIGQALGARYILTGRVRRSTEVVGVSMQLFDPDAGTGLWSDTAEVAPGELFRVQDEIVERVVPRIAPSIRAAQLRGALRKRPENFTAYDWTLRALHVISSLDANNFLRAREFLNQAMEEDPNFAMPVAWAARWHSLYIGQGWSANPTQDAATASNLAAKAIKLDGHDAVALATYGHLRSFLFHDCESALLYFDRALAACADSPMAWLLSSGTLSYVGRCEEAVQRAKHALRLSPMDRSRFYYYNFLSLAHYACGRYQEAVEWGKMAEAENFTYTSNLRFLTASLAALGRLDEARETAMRLLRLDPGFRLSRFENANPFQAREIRVKYVEHLRKAGLPE
jgi:adenylate cyclase